MNAKRKYLMCVITSYSIHYTKLYEIYESADRRAVGRDRTDHIFVPVPMETRTRNYFLRAHANPGQDGLKTKCNHKAIRTASFRRNDSKVPCQFHYFLKTSSFPVAKVMMFSRTLTHWAEPVNAVNDELCHKSVNVPP